MGMRWWVRVKLWLARRELFFLKASLEGTLDGGGLTDLQYERMSELENGIIPLYELALVPLKDQVLTWKASYNQEVKEHNYLKATFATVTNELSVLKSNTDEKAMRKKMAEMEEQLRKEVIVAREYGKIADLRNSAVTKENAELRRELREKVISQDIIQKYSLREVNDAEEAG